MRYIEVTVNTPAEEIDLRCQQMADMGAGGFVIENEEDFRGFLESNHQYWDYVDEELMQDLDPEILQDRYAIKVKDLTQQAQTAAVGEIHIQNQQVKSIFRQHFPGLCQVWAAKDGCLRPCQGHSDPPPQGLIVL